MAPVALPNLREFSSDRPRLTPHADAGPAPRGQSPFLSIFGQCLTNGGVPDSAADVPGDVPNASAPGGQADSGFRNRHHSGKHCRDAASSDPEPGAPGASVVNSIAIAGAVLSSLADLAIPGASSAVPDGEVDGLEETGAVPDLPAAATSTPSADDSGVLTAIRGAASGAATAPGLEPALISASTGSNPGLSISSAPDTADPVNLNGPASPGGDANLTPDRPTSGVVNPVLDTVDGTTPAATLTLSGSVGDSDSPGIGRPLSPGASRANSSPVGFAIPGSPVLQDGSMNADPSLSEGLPMQSLPDASAAGSFSLSKARGTDQSAIAVSPSVKGAQESRQPLLTGASTTAQSFLANNADGQLQTSVPSMAKGPGIVLPVANTAAELVRPATAVPSSSGQNVIQTGAAGLSMAPNPSTANQSQPSQASSAAAPVLPPSGQISGMPVHAGLDGMAAGSGMPSASVTTSTASAVNTSLGHDHSVVPAGAMQPGQNAVAPSAFGASPSASAGPGSAPGPVVIGPGGSHAGSAGADSSSSNHPQQDNSGSKAAGINLLDPKAAIVPATPTVPTSVPSGVAAPPDPSSMHRGLHAWDAVQNDETIRPASLASPNELHLSVHTDELGRVDLHATLHGDSVGATISVQKSDVGAAIAAGLPHLEHILHEQQIPVSHLNLNQGGAGTSHSNSQSHGQSGQQPRRTPWTGISERAHEPPAGEAGPVPGEPSRPGSGRLSILA